MPFCTECGANNESNRAFCTACGSPLEPESRLSSPTSRPIRGQRTEPLSVLLLGFVTCGIYNIFWCSRRAREINVFLSRQAISPTTAALSPCCPPVHAYVFYAFGQSIPDMQRSVGIEARDRSITYMLLGIFLSPVAAMIVQGELNRIWDKVR